MSILKKPLYPEKVEIVNQNGTSDNPQKSEVVNLPLNSNGSVNVYGTISSIYAFRPSNNGAFNVFLDNILLLQGDGTFVPIPLCTFLSNVTTSQLNNALSSYKSAYSTLVSGVTAATLHYSKMTNTGAVTSEVYNLKD